MIVLQISAHPHQHKNQCISEFLALWFQGQSDGDNPIARGLKYGIQPRVKINKEDIIQMVRNGLIYYNQKKIPHLPYQAQGKCKLLIAIPDIYLKNTKTSDQTLNEKNIMYEDDDMVIIDKPSGLPSQSTLDIFEDHALSQLMSYYIKKSKGIKAPYLNLMHRLDKDTSGLLMFSKKINANKNLTALFETRKIQKSYLAMVSKATYKLNLSKVKINGNTRSNLDTDLQLNYNVSSENKIYKLGDTFKVTGLIKKDPQPGMSFYFTLNQKGGQFSETDFKILKETEKYFLIECRPKTGRSHQIRVHLKSVGLPILGDAFYNPECKHPRLMLHAWSLKFKHPISNKEIVVKAPEPSAFLF